ncbi:MAG: insulinase family protein, partial [Ignavibacteria bacterium]|nr:insulinase family protein [Ignavibacteria bacterium]
MKKLFFVFALFAISITSAFSQPIKQRSMDELLPFDPNVKIGVLDNGLKYYIRHNKLPENRAELRLVIKAGSVQEDNDQQGLAHFIEHMCFNGTKNFPKNDLINFLEETGLRFGADLNANTGFDRTYYLLTIP